MYLYRIIIPNRSVLPNPSIGRGPYKVVAFVVNIPRSSRRYALNFELHGAKMAVLVDPKRRQ